MKRFGAVLAAGAVFCAQVTPAYACGPGIAYMEEHANDPEFYPLSDALSPPETFASRLDTWDEEDSSYPDEVRFNYPFQFAPDVGHERWNELRSNVGGYGWSPPSDKALADAAAVDLKALLAALERNDATAAHRAAQQAVDGVLDMPANVAQDHALTLKRAVEYLELEPTLSGVPGPVLARYFSPGPTPADVPPALAEAARIRTLERAKAGDFAKAHPKSPRAPSLEFVDLQERLKALVPNGWSAQVEASPAVAGPVKSSLGPAQQAWLVAHPQHPLADLVRLFGARLALVQGDTDAAWKAVLSVYPRHRMRAVGEWYYLFNLGKVPADLAPYRADPYLRTALLLPSTELSPEAWSKEWANTTAHAREPWAVNAQERLLYLLVGVMNHQPPKVLPKGFPSAAMPAPTPFWARMRLKAFLVTRRYEDAAQALKAYTSQEGVSPALRASLAMAMGRPQQAALVPGLDEHARAYLLRARLSDTDLQALTQGAEAPVAAEAAQVLAERRIAQGDWTGAAAAVKAKDSGRATRYEAIARLAADSSPAGQLALARALRDQAAALLPLGADVEWYRSVAARLNGLAQDPTMGEETKSARAILLTGNAKVLSLEAFARYLSATGTPPAEAKRALKEADGVYNGLIGWDNPTTTFYRDVLKSSDAAKAIRAAGLRLKNVK